MALYPEIKWQRCIGLKRTWSPLCPLVLSAWSQTSRPYTWKSQSSSTEWTSPCLLRLIRAITGVDLFYSHWPNNFLVLRIRSSMTQDSRLNQIFSLAGVTSEAFWIGLQCLHHCVYKIEGGLEAPWLNLTRQHYHLILKCRTTCSRPLLVSNRSTIESYWYSCI